MVAKIKKLAHRAWWKLLYTERLLDVNLLRALKCA